MARASSDDGGLPAPAATQPAAEAATRVCGLAPHRLRALRAQHRRLTLLCDTLEAIADELPRPSTARCRQALAELDIALPRHHQAESSMLATVLGPDRADLLALIRRQHDEDEGMAGEIAGALASLAEGGLPDDAETLGYMLRCFFTAYRRAMLIEELAIMAVARDPVRATAARRSGRLGHRLEP